MGEAVSDEEYLRSCRQQPISSASEEDEEFWLEEEECSLSTSEDFEEPQRHKKIGTRD